MSQQIGSRNENQIPVSHPGTGVTLQAILNALILNNAYFSVNLM